MNGVHNHPVEKKIILVKITQRLFLTLLLLLYVNGLLLRSQIKKVLRNYKTAQKYYRTQSSISHINF